MQPRGIIEAAAEGPWKESADCRRRQHHGGGRGRDTGCRMRRGALCKSLQRYICFSEKASVLSGQFASQRRDRFSLDKHASL
jgi:hypothetical protein